MANLMAKAAGIFDVSFLFDVNVAVSVLEGRTGWRSASARSGHAGPGSGSSSSMSVLVRPCMLSELRSQQATLNEQARPAGPVVAGRQMHLLTAD